MSLAPAEPLAGGTRFWENVSLESLDEASLDRLLGREASPASTEAPEPSAGPSATPPAAAGTSSGRPAPASSKANQQRPTSIALPSPPRMPAAAKPASPLSPKLYGWNFLRRTGAGAAATAAPTAGPSTTTSTGKIGRSGVPPNRTVEVASAPPRKHRSSLTLPAQTSFDQEEGRLIEATYDRGAEAGAGSSSNDPSAPAVPSTAHPNRPQRPGQSRSSTWTDSLPTVRTLALGQDLSAPVVSPRMATSSSASSSSSSRLDPFGGATMAKDPVLLVPIVAPRKDNLARGGRFGLFRRGSLSPRVEKTGFTIGGRLSDGGAKERPPRKSSKDSSIDLMAKPAKRRHRGSFGSLASIGGGHQQRSSSPVSWGPRAEEMRHVASTTASPPPEGVHFGPASPSSDAVSLRSYFPTAAGSSAVGDGALASHRSSLPRSSLHATADLHQLAHPPSSSALVMSSSPVNQSPLRQSIDDPDLPRPHITFGAPPAPASPLRVSAPTFPPSHSESSLSLQTSGDSDEDFPVRSGARKAVKSHRLRKATQVKIGGPRERSVSPLRYASDGEAFDSQGEDSARGRLKAWQWWKPAGGVTSPSGGGAFAGRPGSAALTPASSTDRPPKRGKSSSSKVSQRGFKVTSRPISAFEPSATGRPVAELGFPPTPPPTTLPTPAADRSIASTREPSPNTNDSLLSASRPAAVIRQTTVTPSSGNVSVRTTSAQRKWQPPAKAAPRPPTAADHRALPPVNTASVAVATGALVPAVRKDSLSPPSASSCEAPSPLSAFGTATEGDEATTNSEHELATTEEGSYRFASHHGWQPRVQTASSERSWDGDSILQRVESRLGGQAGNEGLDSAVASFTHFSCICSPGRAPV